MVKTGYSEPKLNECNADITKEWYVGFRHTCPTCLIRKMYQIRMGINHLKLIMERRAEGRGVAKILSNSLRDGWNPHHESIDDFVRKSVELTEQNASNNIGLMGLNAALDFSMERKKVNLAAKSYSCFMTAKKYAQAAAIKLQYYNMPVMETKRRHIKELMDQICRTRQQEYDLAGKGKKITGNFYNKYKGYLQCIFSELVEYDALEYNPCDRIKDKLKIRTNIHRHATQKERDVIKSHLQLNCPQFYYYLLMEYMAGIRPKEIFFIRICDIDWFNQSLNIHAYDEATKDREARKVPIPNVLMKHLKAMKLERFKPTDYLFSNAFRPGAERKKRDYATKLWKELIRDQLGLDVSLYSFKGLGGEDKRRAGVAPHAVSSQYGHSNFRTTFGYLREEQERMDTEIREKTREL